MNCMAWLWLLVLVIQGILSCPENCYRVNTATSLEIKHFNVSSNKYAATWDFDIDSDATRDPETLIIVKCATCRIRGFVAKPIIIQVQVNYRRNTHKDNPYWCRCPYHLPVACTCLKPHASHLVAST
ncbi:unnamed protein product [Merluccius merluccius]